MQSVCIVKVDDVARNIRFGVVWANSPDKADRDLGNLALFGSVGQVADENGIWI